MMRLRPKGLRFLEDISSFFDISVSKFQNSVGNLPKDEGFTD